MRSSGSQTQTTTSEPPAYLRPYLTQAADATQSTYATGGVPVTPFSPQTEQALKMAESRAVGGSPVARAAQDYATQSLQGGFIGKNPYLDATFNQAARATQNQLTSEFALGGRNLDAREPIRADQLNNLATSIYGSAYDADRNRQQAMVPYVTQLANQDYADIGQLANVGAQREALLREQMNQPANNLDAYIARLQGFPGSSTTSNIPMERNVLSGALGGSMLGNQMFGGWGGIGGAILGGMYG